MISGRRLRRAVMLHHRYAPEGGYQTVVELGPSDSLDASVIGIDPIPIADVFAAAQRRT